MRLFLGALAAIAWSAPSAEAFVSRPSTSFRPHLLFGGSPSTQQQTLETSSSRTHSSFSVSLASSLSDPGADSQGTFRPFADYAWQQLVQQPGLELVDLPDEFSSQLVPAKSPKDHQVRLTAKALLPSDPETNIIRYARMVLLETIPKDSSSNTTTTFTDGIQVLNFVIFPHAHSELPVWGADFVCLPGDKYLLLMDAQPMTYDFHTAATLDMTFQKWHTQRVSDEFVWGGAMPEAVMPYISSNALWTRLKNEPEPVAKLQGPLLEAFQEHLVLYLQLLKDNTDKIGDGSTRNKQASYLRYRVENDPARPMLKSLFGDDWTERMLKQVLFPAMDGSAPAFPTKPIAKVSSSQPSKFFVNITDDVPAANSIPPLPPPHKEEEITTLSKKIQVQGIPWRASQQEIVQHFSSFGQVVSCKLLTQNDGQSNGIALLEFADLSSAMAAVKTDGMDYFGQGILRIKYGHSFAKQASVERLNKAAPVFASSRVVAKSKASSADTKVYIRGLPWKVSNQEVIQYFSSCGEIVSCKLTLEGDGRATGEASIEFAQPEGADKAVAMDGADYFGYGVLSVQYVTPKKVPQAVEPKAVEKPVEVERSPIKDEVATKKDEVVSNTPFGSNSTVREPEAKLETAPVKVEPTPVTAKEAPVKVQSPVANKEVAAAYDVVNQWDEIYKALEGDKQELVDLRARLETLEKENQSLQKELASTSNVVSQWEEKYNTMTIDRDSLSTRSESLEKENQGLRQELGSVADASSQSGEKSKELEAEREKLNARVETLESENRDLQKLLATAKETMSLSDQKFNEVEAERKEISKRLEALEAENNKLQLGLTSASDATTQADEKYASLENEKNDLKKRVEVLEKENQELKAGSANATEAVSESEVKLKVLEYEQKELKERFEALTKENADLKQELASSSEIASNEFQKSMGLEEARRKLQKKVEALEKESTAMKRELTSAQALVTQSDEDVKDLFEERKKILARLDQQESENVDLKEKLALTNEAVSEWKKKFAALEKDRDSLLAKLGSKEGDSSPSRSDTDKDAFASRQREREPEPEVRNSSPRDERPLDPPSNDMYSPQDEQLNAEMEARIRYLEEQIEREERRLQERDGARSSFSQPGPPPMGRPGGITRLIVTGLNWRMSREEVYQQFATFGDLISCELPLHADGRPVGKAILEYGDEESARRAMMMNGDIFGPGVLSIQVDNTGQRGNMPPQGRPSVGAYPRSDGPPGNMQVAPYKKILVQGIPWRAQQQDMIDYFGAFGPITSCKLQVENDGRKSGTAVIEFGTAEAAARAMQMNGRDYYGDGRLTMQYLSPSGTPVHLPKQGKGADEDSAWYN